MKRIVNIITSSGLIKGFMSISLWGGISKLSMFALTFIGSNMLTPEDFGEFSFIRNTLNTIIAVCATGFSSIATKFASESISLISSLKKLYLLIIFTLLISIIASLTLILLPSENIGSYVGNNMEVVKFLKLLSFLLPISILQPIISSILQGYKQFSKSGIYEMSMSCICVISVILGIQLMGKKGAIIALILYYFFFSLVGIYILYKYNKANQYIYPVKNLSSEISCVKKIIIPVFVMSFIELPIMWISQAYMANRGAYDLVGILSVILTVRTIIQFVPSYFYQAMTPYVSQDNINQDYNRYFRRFDKLSLFLGLIVLVMLPILLFFGKNILYLFGESYIDNYNPYAISIVILPLILFSVHYKLNMMIREHQRSMLIMSIISSCVFLVLFMILSTHINILNAFFYAQGMQYSVQLCYSLIIYLKDKKKCLVLC